MIKYSQDFKPKPDMPISRNRVMSYLNDLWYSCSDPEGNKPFLKGETAVEWAMEEIEEMPRYTGEWIPVSERLPSAEDCPMDCMVTRRSKYIGNYTDMAVAEANGTWTHEDWKAITIDGNATCISTRDADIIAWMPLPEPYKGGETE